MPTWSLAPLVLVAVAAIAVLLWLAYGAGLRRRTGVRHEFADVIAFERALHALAGDVRRG